MRKLLTTILVAMTVAGGLGAQSEDATALAAARALGRAFAAVAR